MAAVRSPGQGAATWAASSGPGTAGPRCVHAGAVPSVSCTFSTDSRVFISRDWRVEDTMTTWLSFSIMRTGNQDFKKFSG